MQCTGYAGRDAVTSNVDEGDDGSSSYRDEECDCLHEGGAAEAENQSEAGGVALSGRKTLFARVAETEPCTTTAK